MWKKVENGITIYHLRIGIQKFTSSEQIDRNGETYWRYYELKKEEGNKEVQLTTDPSTKFNQRQEQVKNYEQTEPTTSQ